MSGNDDWLHRLNNALDYEALQQTFSEIQAKAHAGADLALARSIDDAIRRIEEERSRDQRELSEIQTRYDTFREENSGVVGWFKRHMPFSETRREDVKQREELADQQAEILADNLVIARAQMLKERLLPPAERRLGKRPVEWQAVIEAGRCVEHLSALAAVVTSLAAEIQRSELFLQLLQNDVDAFSRAAFKSPADRQRRDADLTTARHELAELANELEQENGLKRQAFERLGRLVSDELTAADSAFREDSRRIAELQVSLTRLNEAHDAVSRLVESVGTISTLAKELHALPEALGQTRQLRDRIAREQSDAAVLEARLAAVCDERKLRFDESRRALELAQQTLASVHQWQAQHEAQRLAQKSMAQAVEAEVDDSPYAHRLREAQSGAATAQATLNEAQRSYDAAKLDAERASTALETIKTQAKATNDKLTSLDERGPQLRRELSEAVLAGQLAFTKAATAVAVCLNAEPGARAALPAAPYGWLSGQGLGGTLAEALLGADYDYQRHLQAASVVEQLLNPLESYSQSIERERSAVAARRDAKWKDRCSELVGRSLAEELFRAVSLN